MGGKGSRKGAKQPRRTKNGEANFEVSEVIGKRVSRRVKMKNMPARMIVRVGWRFFVCNGRLGEKGFKGGRREFGKSIEESLVISFQSEKRWLGFKIMRH